MTVPAYPKKLFLTRTKPRLASKPEREEAVPLQEQFTGPLPECAGRPAAELLSERLAEADSAGPSQLFIP